MPRKYELQSAEASSKRRSRKTPERDIEAEGNGDWDVAVNRVVFDHTGPNKRGPPVTYAGVVDDLSPAIAGNNRPYQRTHGDDFSNYNNHANNMNHRYNNNINNIYNKRFHYSGGGGNGNNVIPHENYDPSYHPGGYNHRNDVMERPYNKHFDRDRPRYYHNGYNPLQQIERFSRGDQGCNGPPNGHNGFYQDRRRPVYRMNGRPDGRPYNNFGGSPSMRRRWSNGDEPNYHFQQRNAPYYNANGNNLRYRDGSNCGNGHDSGGSNGYEGGSSETQSEPEEKQPLHQSVQSILINNDQYTKIQTPRQEVIFKKNASGVNSTTSTCRASADSTPTSDNNSTKPEPLNKRTISSNNNAAKNKKNRTETTTGSKSDSNKKSLATASKRQDHSNSARKSSEQSSQTKKYSGNGGNITGSINQHAEMKNRSTTDAAGSINKDGGGGGGGGGKNKKGTGRAAERMSARQEGDETASDDQQPTKDDEEDDEYCAESDDEEEEEMCYAQEDYTYMQNMQDESEACSAINPNAPPLAGVIMQQCYPGGPMVSIPVHWTPFLDPTLIPGDTALTPLDPAFTHLLDPSFQPLDLNKWDTVDAVGNVNTIIPDTVIPIQHDSSGCPITVQVKVDQNGVPIQIEPSSFTVQLSSLQQHHHHHHHPSCQMAGIDLTMPFHYAPPYADDAHSKSQYFEYNFDEGLEKRLEAKIDEELAKHYSDEEEEEEEDYKDGAVDDGQNKKTKKDERGDSQDCEETSCDSQYASMSEGSSLPTSPAGELSDCQSACPPNTPSSTDTHHQEAPRLLEESSPLAIPKKSLSIVSSSAPSPASSSISISSVSTLCASSSSSSSTLVSLSSSPVNSGNPSKETSPSSCRQSCSEKQQIVAGDTATTPDVDDETDTATEDDTNNSALQKNNTQEHIISSTEGNTMETDVTKIDAEHGHNAENLSTKPITFVDENIESVKGVQKCKSYSAATENSDADSSVNGLKTTEPCDNPTVNDIDGGKEDKELLLEENGVTVTVKPGYVMVPILTPYYDPSVLYGYSMEVNGPTMDRPYSSTSRKKKKKHNRRRTMENNSGGYLDPEMYAGEPYIATHDGYLIPMDAASHLCHYQHPGSMQYVHPMQQYQYQMMPQVVMHAQHYHPNSDEGFVSVEHTPHLPDHLPEPSCSVTGPSARDCRQPNEENKFGVLHETERQQIEEVLLEAKSSIVEEIAGADMSDSGVSETEEVSTVAGFCTTDNQTNSSKTEEKLLVTAENSSSEEANCSKHDPTELVTSSDSKTSKLFEDDTVKSTLIDSKINEKSILTTKNEQLTSCESEPSISIISTKSISICDKQETVEIEESLPNSDTNTNAERDGGLDELTCRVENVTTSKSESSYDTRISSAQKLEVVPLDLPSNDVVVSFQVNEVENEKSLLTYQEASVPSNVKLVGSLEDSEISSSHSKDERKQIPLEIRDQASVSLSETSENKTDSSGIKESSTVVSNTRDKSDSTSTSDESFDENYETVLKLQHEMEEAKSLIDTRISNQISKFSQTIEESEPENASMKDLRVTEAVKRWIREVTPEKIFSLSEEAQSMIMDHRLETSDEDEYFEDNVVEQVNKGEELFVDHKTSSCDDDGNKADKITQNTSTSSKNVKGNPFGALRSDLSCAVRTTKRVASCSTSDVLDDYDGCSCVSNLSNGALFSPSSSQVVSQSSSRTITPTRNIDEVSHEDIIHLKSVTCDPSGYRKYYQLAVEVDDSPSGTACQQSPQESESLHSSTRPSTVLPLAAEILEAKQNCRDCRKARTYELCQDSSQCRHSHLSSSTSSSLPPSPVHCCHTDTKPSSLSSSVSSATSTYSSGLGSSLSTTPTNSPHHPPHPRLQHFSRLPFYFIPADMRADTNSVPLNAVHCCSLM